MRLPTVMFVVRRSKGMTQAALADAVGVTQARISMAENPNRWDYPVSKGLLQKIAETLEYEGDPMSLLETFKGVQAAS